MEPRTEAMPVVLSMRGVSKSYDAKQVLDVERLDLHRGETLALVGPSGSGKTTLLRLAIAAIPATRGTIRLLDHDIVAGHLDIHTRRRVGMVYQRPVLLSASVRDNVAYGARVRGEVISDREIDRVLERLWLNDLARRHAAGLSGGERQRVALARALVLRPEILFLDEPTSHLEPAGVTMVESLLRELRSDNQTAIVVATHNVHQARRLADRTALVWDGAIIEEAPSSRFFNEPTHKKTQAFLRGDLIY